MKTKFYNPDAINLIFRGSEHFPILLNPIQMLWENKNLDGVLSDHRPKKKKEKKKMVPSRYDGSSLGNSM